MLPLNVQLGSIACSIANCADKIVHLHYFPSDTLELLKLNESISEREASAPHICRSSYISVCECVFALCLLAGLGILRPTAVSCFTARTGSLLSPLIC